MFAGIKSPRASIRRDFLTPFLFLAASGQERAIVKIASSRKGTRTSREWHMLMLSVSRRSMLTRYERVSSQETAVKRSSCAVSSAAFAIHCHHGEFFQVSEDARRSSPAACGAKSVRVKKYGCGRSAGWMNAELALRILSGRVPLDAPERPTRTAALRRNSGANRALAISRETCAVARKVLYPPKISSLPKPDKATFRPACRAAQEMK